MDAMPTPKPAAKRKRINAASVGEKAIPREEKAKITAEHINPPRRPKRSEIFRAKMHPPMAPIARQAVENPSQYASSPNCTLKKGRALEITAKSNPNK